jgi:hypothetical protein
MFKAAGCDAAWNTAECMFGIAGTAGASASEPLLSEQPRQYEQPEQYEQRKQPKQPEQLMQS